MLKNRNFMTALREWGTPLTISSFIIMGITGGLMFFHQAMALNGMLHRWSGLVMIVAVVMHVIVNWSSIERYLKKARWRAASSPSALYFWSRHS